MNFKIFIRNCMFLQFFMFIHQFLDYLKLINRKFQLIEFRYNSLIQTKHHLKLKLKCLQYRHLIYNYLTQFGL